MKGKLFYYAENGVCWEITTNSPFRWMGKPNDDRPFGHMASSLEELIRQIDEMNT